MAIFTGNRTMAYEETPNGIRLSHCPYCREHYPRFGNMHPMPHGIEVECTDPALIIDPVGNGGLMT